MTAAHLFRRPADAKPAATCTARLALLGIEALQFEPDRWLLRWHASGRIIGTVRGVAALQAATEALQAGAKR